MAVSPEVRDDLVALGVAPPAMLTVVPLGFDLSRFLHDDCRAERRRAVRAAWGVDPADQVVTLIARLVPIKRVDRFLDVAGALAARAGTSFVIVGDGELREGLETSAAARALGSRLHWAGFRRDMADVCWASDVVVLTSDNEGTPVSLIEAQAAAVPVVSTDVGGVPFVVRHGVTGLLAPVGDPAALARAIAAVLDDADLAGRLAAAGRRDARERFALERLVEDIDKLYRGLLDRSGPGRRTEAGRSARGGRAMLIGRPAAPLLSRRPRGGR